MGQKSRKAALNKVREFGVLPQGREGAGGDVTEELRLPTEEDGARLRIHGAESTGSESTGAEGPGGDSEKLHRIRDLLFGEESRDQARRVESLERSMTAALGEVEQRFQQRLDAVASAAESAQADLKAAFEAELRALGSELEATQAELRTAQEALNTQAHGKVERSDFAAMLGELAKRVGDGDSEDAS